MGVVVIGDLEVTGKFSEEYPIKLTGFKNTPKFSAAIATLVQRHEKPVRGLIGFELIGMATSSTSAYVRVSTHEDPAFGISVSYVACGN